MPKNRSGKVIKNPYTVCIQWALNPSVSPQAMQKVFIGIAFAQTIFHYLGWGGILLGVVALLFGNTSRGVELLIGGASFVALKYIIGLVSLFAPISTKKDDEEPKSRTREVDVA